MGRQPSVVIVVAPKGTGKTWRVVMEAVEYITHHPTRKVIIFDTNNESSYQAFKPIKALDIAKLKKNVATIRRVEPINAYTGVPFDLDEKAQMAFYLMNSLEDTLLVLEDPNNYMMEANVKPFVSKITTNRQPRLDIIMNYQSFGAIQPRVFANSAFMRLHYTNENLKNPTTKKKLPDADLYRLAQIIIAQHYRAGAKRRYIYIDIQGNKMVGISQDEETENCSLRQVTADELAQACALHLRKSINSPEVQEFVEEKMFYIE